MLIFTIILGTIINYSTRIIQQREKALGAATNPIGTHCKLNPDGQHQ